jgi:hypothetical protein
MFQNIFEPRVYDRGIDNRLHDDIGENFEYSDVDRRRWRFRQRSKSAEERDRSDG